MSGLQVCPFDMLNLTRILEILGNGKVETGLTVLLRVATRLLCARAMHPRFAEGKEEALKAIGSEWRELAQAFEREGRGRQEDEALDVIAACLRFLAREDNGRMA